MIKNISTIAISIVCSGLIATYLTTEHLKTGASQAFVVAPFSDVLSKKNLSKNELQLEIGAIYKASERYRKAGYIVLSEDGVISVPDDLKIVVSEDDRQLASASMPAKSLKDDPVKENINDNNSEVIGTKINLSDDGLFEMIGK